MRFLAVGYTVNIIMSRPTLDWHRNDRGFITIKEINHSCTYTLNHSPFKWDFQSLEMKCNLQNAQSYSEQTPNVTTSGRCDQPAACTATVTLQSEIQIHWIKKQKIIKCLTRFDRNKSHTMFSLILQTQFLNKNKQKNNKYLKIESAKWQKLKYLIHTVADHEQLLIKLNGNYGKRRKS